MNYQESMRALAQQQNDALIAPRFYTDAVKNEKASKEAGRPIFDDVEFIEIKFAGDKTRVHVAPAHDKHLRDKVTNEWQTYAEIYAPLYQRFKAGLTEQGSGTPLSELPFLSVSKRSELSALNIKTAEALAALDGSALKSIGMGGRELKNQAIAYLEKAAGGADVAKYAAENEGLRMQMAELQKQMAELLAAAKKPTAGEPEGPSSGEPSAFDDFEDDDIRAWLKDGGFQVDARWARATLLKKANEANEELRKRKAGV